MHLVRGLILILKHFNDVLVTVYGIKYLFEEVKGYPHISDNYGNAIKTDSC